MSKTSELDIVTAGAVVLPSSLDTHQGWAGWLLATWPSHPATRSREAVGSANLSTCANDPSDGSPPAR